MHMLRKEWNDGGIRHQCKAFGGRGTKERRLVAEDEENSFADAARLQQGRQHGAGGLRKIALGRERRSKIGERFDCSQEPAKISLLYAQVCGANDQSRKGYHVLTFPHPLGSS